MNAIYLAMFGLPFLLILVVLAKKMVPAKARKSNVIKMKSYKRRRKSSKRR